MAERMERQEEADRQAESAKGSRTGGTGAGRNSGEEPVIVIRGLHKSFGDHEVLRGVDLHVNKGENLVILGKSGTGKSVLIKCLVGLEWPDEGEIKDIRRGSAATLNYRDLNAVRMNGRDFSSRTPPCTIR
jgi:ABC-type glutathione transport system ATPase component